MILETFADLVLTLRNKTVSYEWELLALEVRESLDAVYRATARISTEAPGPPIEEVVGARIELSIDDDQERSFRLTGVVLECSYERTHHGHVFLQVRVGPALALLEHQRCNRIFQALTAAEIASQVTQDTLIRFGGELNLWNVAVRQLEPRDYAVQWDESDLAFLSRILADEGIFWQFDHRGKTEVAILLDSTHALPPLEHDPVLPFDPRGESQEPSIRRITRSQGTVTSEATARAWEWKGKEPMHRETTSSASGSTFRFGRTELFGSERSRETTVEELDRDRTKHNALLAAQRAAVLACQIEGESDAIELRAGCSFSVSHHPSAEFEELLYVTHVVHTFTRDLEEDAVTPRFSYRNDFIALPTALPYRPPRRPVARIFGPQTAIVVTAENDGAVIDALGRVRVAFPWSPGQNSCYLRVAQAWAGPGYGFSFHPRPGMEVVVSFLHGNPECPIIMGRVHSGFNTTPHALPDNFTNSTIRTQSYPGGGGYNELRFEDAKGRERIVLRAEKRMDTCVHGTLLETVAGNREVRIGHHDKGDLNAVCTP